MWDFRSCYISKQGKTGLSLALSKTSNIGFVASWPIRGSIWDFRSCYISKQGRLV